MKTHRGLGVIDTDKEHETCCIYLITHDEVLASELKNYVQLVKNYKFEDFISEPTKDKYICIAVSHPHGQPKHVTIGDRKLLPGQKRDDATSYCYSTDTCEGSSGAPVVAFLSKSPFLLQFWAPHSEYLEECKVNKSGRVSSFKISPIPIEVIQAQMIGQIGKENLTLHEVDIEEYDGPLLYGQYSLHVLQIQALLDSQKVGPSDENDKTIQEQVRLMREVACVDYVDSLDQRKDFLWLYIFCLELLLVGWIFCDWVTRQNETWKPNDIYG
ncbi:hypothetical protein PoB_003359200 [Plakobranchus ocellatus]|uniref:Peptidase S1 domain-containing protein n=1 Tax=Plakobranchus ocellatus TaxID=259542 RepID=A0AAV4AIL0_9GAST|nr:hypothetical protein PoB_003359200 [Plakobranchus ocellatus]